MKKPTLRGVNPWFFIFRSMDNHATICDAVHPGLTLTNLRISSRKRRNRASFCAPLAILINSRWRYMRQDRGSPGGPIQQSNQWEGDFPAWLGQLLGVWTRSWLRCLVSQGAMHTMDTEFDSGFDITISLSHLNRLIIQLKTGKIFLFVAFPNTS